MESIQVLILMGSKNDMPVMRKTEEVFEEFGIQYKTLVRSAHRTPEATADAIKDAEAAGCKVFVCAAGMAAHLAGVVCSKTIRPVIGVPIASGALNGEDALLSTVMMPPGMPVATVAINGARNAGILAAQMLAQNDEDLAHKIQFDRAKQAEAILADD